MCGLVPVLGCLADGRGAAPTGGELAAGGDGFVVWPSAPTEVYSLLHRYVTRSTHLMTPIRAQRAVRVPRSTLPPPTTCGCMMAMSEVAEAGAGLQATGESSNAMGFHVRLVATLWLTESSLNSSRAVRIPTVYTIRFMY